MLRPEPKMPAYQEGEDIENYPRRFERLARTWGWPEEEWACRLVPLLTGKALEAYIAMDEDSAEDYENLKEALLEKFNISPETYRQRFRQTSTTSGETPTETYNRLKGLYHRWVRPEQRNKEEIGEIIILEQFLRVLPYEVRTWVKEHEPINGLTAARLATQYQNARRGGPPRPQSTVARGSKVAERENEGNASLVNSKGLVCFYCQQPGHKASNCPIRKPKLSSLCYVPREGDIVKDNTELSDHLLEVMVNGQTVNALVDTGSVMSLIRRCHVQENLIDYSNTNAIQCVHGEQKEYPTTEVTVFVNEQPYLMCVGVVEGLPVDMVLGWDMPVLDELLKMSGKCNAPTTVSCPVLTRAKAKAGLQPLPDFDNSLIQGGNKPRKSRRQCRMEKYLGTPISEVSTEGLEVRDWKIPGNIGQLQAADVTLKPLFDKACEGEAKVMTLGAEMYAVENGVLYVRSDGVKRIVVPECYRSLILHLAHTIPWSGHLAHQKTYNRISSRFYWPSMYTDVRTYCSTCPVCQKTSAVRRSARAPLYPLPVISTPFRRIAMDIVGPLERSSSSNQYILVISDYATRYPEAFPLRTITTAKIIPALDQFFSRVGIPDEIITDQGTNFTSRLMKLLHKQLGISPIQTSPYHPQTDGLVERFNQTLKNMLRKFVSDTGKDGDKWLPFLLFAYREVPQASTGFSPFELVYGWSVQGPLDLLRKNWEVSTASAEGE